MIGSLGGICHVSCTSRAPPANPAPPRPLADGGRGGEQAPPAAGGHREGAAGRSCAPVPAPAPPLPLPLFRPLPRSVFCTNPAPVPPRAAAGRRNLQTRSGQCGKRGALRYVCVGCGVDEIFPHQSNSNGELTSVHHTHAYFPPHPTRQARSSCWRTRSRCTTESSPPYVSRCACVCTPYAWACPAFPACPVRS